MATAYWIVKQEPRDYSWEDLRRERRTAWTGVRNFQARNHLRSMRRGDLVLFYHSGGEKRLVGLARVSREAHPDPTASEGDWSCVELAAVRSLAVPVSLSAIKSDSELGQISLVRQSRLSVHRLQPSEFQRILKLADSPPSR